MSNVTRCDEIRSQMAFYLDSELGGGDLELFEEHLRDCPACCAIAGDERAFVDMVRASRPLYEAPEGLRTRVSEILEGSGEPLRVPDALRGRVTRLIAGRPRWRSAAAIWIAASLVAAVGVLLVVARDSAVRAPEPSEFARLAVDVHSRHVRGQLPLEISTDSPEAVSSWFAGKVPFGLQLPNYQESSGQDLRYRLEGARLVGFRGDYAALVAYEMGNRPISLVVTSSATAMPAGGTEIAMKGLTFHFDAIDGLKVITWADKGLTYALVSELEASAKQSCIVCHEGAKDRELLDALNAPL